MKKFISGSITLFIITIFFSLAITVSAADEVIENKTFFINLDKATIAKGYTVTAFAEAIKLSLIPGILDEATGVDVVELNELIDQPWELDRISSVYQFEFRNKAAYDNTKPFIIQINYDVETTDSKQVYFYDKGFGAWRPLPTKDFVEDKMVRAYIHLPFARIAVFSNPEIMGSGRASWYGFKGGDFAASPDYAKSSRLRVWNHDNSKFVDVEINDYGPNRNLHPGRVIDLDKVAFTKLAPLGAGIINVSIEPLEIVQSNSRVMGIKIDSIKSKPVIEAKSAIAIDAKTGEVLFAKNENKILPLASLTKLVTASVFLDTNPDFDQVVTYDEKDEEITWEHVNKYESARLRLANEDELTIKDLFLATLMASTNNSAETLVRVSGLERTEFIALMNTKVQEWGATSTIFYEPTGLAPQNMSTVSDYVIISREVLRNPKILEATTLKEYRFETLKENKKFRVVNTNRLLNAGYYITGGKTGYLDEAGYCVMTRATFKNREVIAVIFGAEDRQQSFDELGDLLRYGSRK